MKKRKERGKNEEKQGRDIEKNRERERDGGEGEFSC